LKSATAAPMPLKSALMFDLFVVVRKVARPFLFVPLLTKSSEVVKSAVRSISGYRSPVTSTICGTNPRMISCRSGVESDSVVMSMKVLVPVCMNWFSKSLFPPSKNIHVATKRSRSPSRSMSPKAGVIPPGMSSTVLTPAFSAMSVKEKFPCLSGPELR